MKESDELKAFDAKLQSENLGPLWSSIHALNTIEPKAKPIPYLWKKAHIERHLEEAARLMEVGGAVERRAVFLINPGMKDLQPLGWGGATQTLYAAVQAVKPGEIAPAHRHTTTALRFIMKGRGAEGRVDGEKIPFEPGDYLITPTWAWHDHANQGDETVLWMDCLDTPFTMYMNVCFTEFHPDKQQPLQVPDDYSAQRYEGGMVRPVSDRTPQIAPLGRYKWEQTSRGLEGLSRFDPDPIEGYAVEYINVDGQRRQRPHRRPHAEASSEVSRESPPSCTQLRVPCVQRKRLHRDERCEVRLVGRRLLRYPFLDMARACEYFG